MSLEWWLMFQYRVRSRPRVELWGAQLVEGSNSRFILVFFEAIVNELTLSFSELPCVSLEHHCRDSKAVTDSSHDKESPISPAPCCRSGYWRDVLCISNYYTFKDLGPPRKNIMHLTNQAQTKYWEIWNHVCPFGEPISTLLAKSPFSYVRGIGNSGSSGKIYPQEG